MEVMSSYALFPKVWLWDTYADVWNRMNFFRYFLNSLNVAFWTLIGINIIFSMAAFAFAKLKFPGNHVLFYFFLGLMFVPGITILVPLYLTLNYLNLLDTHTGMILAMINGASPIAIFLFRNYFRSIPHELFESAKIEGAGIFRMLYMIYLPLAIPAMATITTLNFLGIWNNLTLPLVMLNSVEKFTLPIAIINLDQSAFRQWNVLMAGSVFSITPVVLAFFFLQKYYIQGLAAGAVKS